jgi:hypothetical protein
MRIASDNIKELQFNEIFVFGSNERGSHGAGAALYAKEHFGAIQGQGIGIQGQSYGIPTRDRYIETLSIEIIQGYVEQFTQYAKDTPDKTFLVTEIGCGRAHYKPDKIATLFEKAAILENVYLPQSFWDILNKVKKVNPDKPY